VVNAGLWDGRDVVIANLRAVAEAAANITSIIATRGERLALSRIRSSNRDPRQGEFGVEMLNIVEIDTEGRIAAHVEYDPDDIDAAFAELDARYLAGEAAGHARTWSAVMRAYTELNRGELPTTTVDFEDIDHRRAAAMAPGELIEYLRAALDQTPELSIYIEAVHLLSDRGAIVTHAAHGTSREGFDAEWREVSLVTAGGDTFNRCELFDETDLDAALARFEEIDRQASSVEQVSAPDNEGPPGSYA
jgi:hypothetical protein